MTEFSRAEEQITDPPITRPPISEDVFSDVFNIEPEEIKSDTPQPTPALFRYASRIGELAIESPMPVRKPQHKPFKEPSYDQQ